MYTGEELYEMWQSSGLSQRQLAKKLGMNFNKLHGLIFRAQKAEATLSNTNDKLDMIDEGNTRSYVSKGKTIRTLDQLLKECEVDLDIWKVDRHVVNKWDVTMKMPSGDVVTRENFQVKAWLTKLEPEPLKPVIAPVELAIKGIKPSKPKKLKSGKVVILADTHFGFSRDIKTGQLIPFHDREALATTLSILAYVNPDIIVMVGDLLDLAEWSDKFIRSPDMYNTTQPALVEATWYLGQIRKIAPEADVYMLEGNHEERVNRAINKQLPYAYGLSTPDGLPVLSVRNLLGLEHLGITYVGGYPDGQVWLSDNLRAIHGDTVRAKSGATASAMLEDAQATTIFGHVHRMELATKTVFDKDGARTISAFTPGCLCRIDGTVPSVKGRMNWQQGIGVVNFDETFVAPVLVPIEQGKAYYDGMQHKGDNYLQQLKSETGWDF